MVNHLCLRVLCVQALFFSLISVHGKPPSASKTSEQEVKVFPAAQLPDFFVAKYQYLQIRKDGGYLESIGTPPSRKVQVDVLEYDPHAPLNEQITLGLKIGSEAQSNRGRPGIDNYITWKTSALGLQLAIDRSAPRAERRKGMILTDLSDNGAYAMVWPSEELEVTWDGSKARLGIELTYADLEQDWVQESTSKVLTGVVREHPSSITPAKLAENSFFVPHSFVDSELLLDSPNEQRFAIEFPAGRLRRFTALAYSKGEPKSRFLHKDAIARGSKHQGFVFIVDTIVLKTGAEEIATYRVPVSLMRFLFSPDKIEELSLRPKISADEADAFLKLFYFGKLRRHPTNPTSAKALQDYLLGAAEAAPCSQKLVEES